MKRNNAAELRAEASAHCVLLALLIVWALACVALALHIHASFWLGVFSSIAYAVRSVVVLVRCYRNTDRPWRS
jgi:membrane protein implicated in regulation of membrane protease activity